MVHALSPPHLVGAAVVDVVFHYDQVRILWHVPAHAQAHVRRWRARHSAAQRGAASRAEVRMQNGVSMRGRQACGGLAAGAHAPGLGCSSARATGAPGTGNRPSALSHTDSHMRQAHRFTVVWLAGNCARSQANTTADQSVSPCLVAPCRGQRWGQVAAQRWCQGAAQRQGPDS